MARPRLIEIPFDNIDWSTLVKIFATPFSGKTCIDIHPLRAIEAFYANHNSPLSVEEVEAFTDERFCEWSMNSRLHKIESRYRISSCERSRYTDVPRPKRRFRIKIHHND